MHGFVENDRPLLSLQLLKSLAARVVAARQESFEYEVIGGQPRAGQRRDCCARAGNRHDGDARRSCSTDEPPTRIADQRRAGIADERDGLAMLELDEQRRRALRLVMLVISNKSRFDADSR